MRCFDPIFYQKYIHDELSRKERLKIDEHLSYCKKCIELIEKMKIEEVELRELFKEGDINLTPIILEKISEAELKKRANGKKVFYLFLIIFVSLTSSIFLEYISSIPLIGNFLSPLFYIPSLLFAVLNKLLTLDFSLIFLEAGIISSIIFVILLFKNLRIKVETL